MILAFFGGLRHTETMDLKLEKFCSTSEGVSITHSRAKQRSDKRDSKKVTFPPLGKLKLYLHCSLGGKVVNQELQG